MDRAHPGELGKATLDDCARGDSIYIKFIGIWSLGIWGLMSEDLTFEGGAGDDLTGGLRGVWGSWGILVLHVGSQGPGTQAL